MVSPTPKRDLFSSTCRIRVSWTQLSSPVGQIPTQCGHRNISFGLFPELIQAECHIAKAHLKIYSALCSVILSPHPIDGIYAFFFSFLRAFYVDQYKKASYKKASVQRHGGLGSSKRRFSNCKFCVIGWMEKMYFSSSSLYKYFRPE